MSDEAPHRQWRKRWAEMLRTGRRLEKEALMTELPFEVRPDWPGLDWVVWHETLEAFSVRVRRVSERLGSPESVTGKHWLGATDDERPPDLVAEWVSTTGTHFTVRALQPTGCKVDPRTKYQKHEEPGLHPECRAVLRSLEDA